MHMLKELIDNYVERNPTDIIKKIEIDILLHQMNEHIKIFMNKNNINKVMNYVNVRFNTYKLKF
jgi:hypothetical protein